MDLIFASNNKSKLKEVTDFLKPLGISVIGMNSFGLNDEISETADSFFGNALIKARYVFEKCNKDCFADDSGLEVEALGGAPGVYSARYAGEPKNDAANISKLLSNLNGQPNRKANFKTVITLIKSCKEYFFEGTIYGEITTEPRGENGFGYDSVFIPDGYNKTFAQMSAEEKNNISHRAEAIKKMYEFLALQQLNINNC